MSKKKRKYTKRAPYGPRFTLMIETMEGMRLARAMLVQNGFEEAAAKLLEAMQLLEKYMSEVAGDE